MNTPVDWSTIAAPLDVFDIEVSPHFLRRWTDYERVEGGVRLRAETLGGLPVNVQIDVIQPDVIRLRMSRDPIAGRPSAMLVADALSSRVPFGLDVHAAGPDSAPDSAPPVQCLALTTARLRVEVSQFPWQVRVFDRDDDALPFFSQQITDRCYGPAYEVAPVGFDESPDGALTVREAVAVAPGEAFYGFGERFTALDKWGHTLESWAVDSGNVTSHRAYKNVPFFMSTAGYGVFVHSSFPMLYRMGSESSLTYSFHVAEDTLDYFLLRGPAFSHILARYAALTGHAPLPPLWSFGFWQSRAGYRSQAEVAAVAAEMRAQRFPCDVISIDPWWMGEAPWSTLEWDADQFPDPAALLAALREQGMRVCLWITPYMPEGTAIFDEGRANGYFITDGAGQIAPVLEAFAGGRLAAVDFTNPDAEAWFLGKLQRLLDQGVATFKTDFGEQAPVDAVYHDGRGGLELHNLYPLLYNRAVFGLTERAFGRGLVWGRAAYAGSQRYPVQWGGDSYACLNQMAGQLRALLSYGLSGVPFCSHDVGGFDYAPAAFDQGQDLNVGEHVSSVSTELLESFPRDPVIYVRWLQFGAFSSHMRAHGKAPHEPWQYGDEAATIARQYLTLRYRLLPYLYAEAAHAAESGLPVVRPLLLDYQDDPATYRLDTQYLFGRDFLVAPVFNHAGRWRAYLPAGAWIDYWTHDVRSGPQWIDGTAPLDVLPLWVRAGAIIALGPEIAHTGEYTLDRLTLAIYAPHGDHRVTLLDADGQPAVTASYTRQGDALHVTVEGAPGSVDVVVIGADVTDGPARRTIGRDGALRFALAGEQ